MKKIITIGLLLLLCMSFLGGCGQKTDPSGNTAQTNAAGATVSAGKSEASSEDFFVWDGNTITALTESGLKQTELVIPDKCEAVAEYACAENPILKKLSFANPDTTIGGGAFYNSPVLSSVNLPANLVIMTDAFSMTAITAIVIPDSVKTIEYSAFDLCHDLKSVALGKGVEEIGMDAFGNNRSIKEISFPASLKTIGERAFSGCASLTTITFAEGLEEIGEDAFSPCTSLTSIKLPEGLTILGNGAFSVSPYITEVYLPATLENIPAGTFSNIDGLNVYVKEGSWADVHFEEYSVKDYDSGEALYAKTYY